MPVPGAQCWMPFIQTPKTGSQNLFSLDPAGSESKIFE
jgi:hypothetical protein